MGEHAINVPQHVNLQMPQSGAACVSRGKVQLGEERKKDNDYYLCGSLGGQLVPCGACQGRERCWRQCHLSDRRHGEGGWMLLGRPG
ncbi:hypothetical protein GDO78_022241 [Eleutherodactylus coqui]|uniref:Uncharacterized protein n=1 Tax=Eleutherodactylus coqui TaxID=57060 RepID=A0A8J6BH06_ELECQ|nr:hypothetical protein GDO78_022241 [Eleutherodactylus coqui]